MTRRPKDDTVAPGYPTRGGRLIVGGVVIGGLVSAALIVGGLVFLRTPGVPAGPEGDAAAARLAGSCDAMIAEFDAILAQSSRACTTPADCDCYPGGLGERSGCGGVTGREGAARLHALGQRFHEAGCTTMVDCAARACRPQCVDGACQ